jgi:hypothetical protein
MYSITEKTKGNVSGLGILFAFVNIEQSRFESEALNLLKRRPTELNVTVAFGWIEGDTHKSDCTHKEREERQRCRHRGASCL